jgi:hypothetical protein
MAFFAGGADWVRRRCKSLRTGYEPPERARTLPTPASLTSAPDQAHSHIQTRATHATHQTTP